jgi:hypothetical protein
MECGKQGQGQVGHLYSPEKFNGELKGAESISASIFDHIQ